MLNLNEFWEEMRTRLNTVHMQTVLGGAARVYVPSDNLDEIPATEGEPDEPWGRIIVLPRATLWPQTDQPGAWQNMAWLVSVQFNDFRASGYDVGIGVAAAHREAFVRLDNWVPEPQPEKVTITVPVWRHGSPPVSPIYDQERKLWLSNAEYRAQGISREE